MLAARVGPRRPHTVWRQRTWGCCLQGCSALGCLVASACRAFSCVWGRAAPQHASAAEAPSCAAVAVRSPWLWLDSPEKNGSMRTHVSVVLHLLAGP